MYKTRVVFLTISSACYYTTPREIAPCFAKTQVASNDILLNITISIGYTNCHITCSKFPPLADTHACSCLSQGCQWLSLARQTKSAKVHL